LICSTKGKKIMAHQRKNVNVGELSTWQHHNNKDSWVKADSALAQVPDGVISFVFSRYRDPASQAAEANVDPFLEAAKNEYDEASGDDHASADDDGSQAIEDCE